MSAPPDSEASRLFGSGGHPSAPVAGETDIFGRNDSPPNNFSGQTIRENTLDEPIWKTFQRDLWRIALNLKLVLLPFIKSSSSARSLANWDLWGPMIFVISLGVILSASHNGSGEGVFAVAFAVVALGAVILTLNIALIGGTIVFFQSLCLLGYCLFPIVMAAFIIWISDAITPFRWVLTLAGVGWAVCASYPFIRETAPPRKKGMAMYPALLLFCSVGWMVIVM